MGSDDDEGEWPLELPVCKCARLAYGPDFKHDDVLLLEMDEAILQEALVDGCVHPDSPTRAVYVRRRSVSSEVRRSLVYGLCQALSSSTSGRSSTLSSAPLRPLTLSVQMCGEPNRALSAMPLTPESPGLAAPSPQAQTLVPRTHTPLSPTHATGGAPDSPATPHGAVRVRRRAR